MAITRAVHKALAVAQVDTLNVGGTWVAGDTITLVINTKQVIITVVGITVAQVCTSIAAAWNASTIPEFAEATAVAGATTVVITMDTAGIPFTQSSPAVVTGNSGTCTKTATTAATGPSFWDNANNWDNGVPAGGDTVFYTATSTPFLYGIDQSALGSALAELHIENTQSGAAIGLPAYNPLGYTEYRNTYLKLNGVTLGYVNDNQATRIRIDAGTTNQSKFYVYATNFGELQGAGNLFLKNTKSTSILEVFGGQVTLCPYGGETSSWATVVNAGGNLQINAGNTVTTLNNYGGNTDCTPVPTTVNNKGGELILRGVTGTTTTMTNVGGRVRYLSGATISTLNLGGVNGGVFDNSKNALAATISQLNWSSGGTFQDPFQLLTFTAIALIGTYNTASLT